MANSIRPTIKRTESASSFTEVRGPESDNSDVNALGSVNYGIIFLVILFTALALYRLRKHPHVVIYTQPGVVVVPSPFADISTIENIINRINAQAAGKFVPKEG